MPQPVVVENPFMLMLDPAAVLAAVEKSERLGGLNRHQCRPLDRYVLPADKLAERGLGPLDDDENFGDA
jgi:hypothetical protein